MPIPILIVALALATGPDDEAPSAEQPVAPYAQADGNAGTLPFQGDGMWRAFHGAAGVDRIVDDLIARNRADPRIADIFKGQDYVRLSRLLKEQFCYVLNGGCHYSGRDMRTAHRDMGVQQADFGALVENLQAAMTQEHVAFAAQNRLLAKLAPMHRDIVTH